MKPTLNSQLFQTICLNYSPNIGQLDDETTYEEGTHRSFTLKVTNTSENIWLLNHFRHLKIVRLKLCYRNVRTRTKKKQEQKKMRRKFENTSELATYLASKKYKIDNFEIRFENGWAITEWCDQFHFITSSTEERNELIDKMLKIGGQLPINLTGLQTNDDYQLLPNGELKWIDPFHYFRNLNN
jgi:hypothetical protein